ncbi:MAG TPA: DoxX family membrane protein [Puia sp.]|nr:DoxX family membrane protein [Puia sp.]
MDTSKSSKISVLIARIILGLIFFVFGLNFFFHFIPNNSQPEGKAAAFLGGLFQSGYIFPLVKVIETICGALLLANRYVALVLVILMPISINILLFHSVLQTGGMPTTISFLIIISQLYLAWAYRDYYKQLFIAKPAL